MDAVYGPALACTRTHDHTALPVEYRHEQLATLSRHVVPQLKLMMGLLSECGELYHARVEGHTGGGGGGAGAAGDEDGDDFTFGDVGDSITMEGMEVATTANRHLLTKRPCGSIRAADEPRPFMDIPESDGSEGVQSDGGARGHMVAHAGADAPSSAPSTTGMLPSYFDPTAVHLPMGSMNTFFGDPAPMVTKELRIAIVERSTR